MASVGRRERVRTASPPPWLKATAILLSAILLVPAGEGSRAWAKPPKKPPAVQDLTPVVQRAETLLDKLEYERAREILEGTVRDPQSKKARPVARSKLWALLGRARAELGDSVGADEAFLQAVMLDRRVKLARTTSPKILEALERARANALPPEGKDRSDELPPEARETKEGRPPRAADEKPKPRPPRAAEKEAHPATPKTREPLGRAKTPTAPTLKRDEPSPPPADAGPKPAPKTGPVLRHRVEGKMGPGKTVTLVLEAERLPKDARLDLQVRRGQSGGFHAEPLVKTGTVSTHRFKMDRPRVELYVRATKAKKVVAQLGSPEDPIVLSALPPPPPIAEAWSIPESRPKLITTSTKSSTATAAGPRTAARAPSQVRASVPPAARATAPEAGGVKRTVVTQVDQPKEKDDDTLLYAGLAAGGAVLIAGAVVLILVLKGGSKKKECDVKEGFGCAQISVLPLISF